MMIKGLVTIAIVLLPMLGQTASLQIDINNSKNDIGVIRILVFPETEKAAFPHTVKPNICNINAPIRKGMARATCPNLASGRYAISAIHDENTNGEFDRNWLGIPLEGYGFSNNAMGTFGPPDFEHAAIEIGEADHRLSINMQYH